MRSWPLRYVNRSKKCKLTIDNRMEAMRSNKHITKELVTNNNTYIIVERPKRLRDCWSLLYQMYQKIMNMIYSVSNFGTELNRIENPTIIETNEDISNFIDYTDGWLQNSKSNMNNLKIILDKYKGKE